MIRIVDVKETRRGRFALFSEEGFLFSVDGETLARFRIEKGAAMDEAELEQLRQSSDTRRAADQALRYLSLRAYGEQELYKKLLLRYDEHSAAAAIAKMVELELLDDVTFARQKAEGMAARGKSPREVMDKLYALGVDRALAAETVGELEIDGAAAALAVVKKQYLEKLRAGKRDNVVAALARRGFTRAEIYAALEQAAGFEDISGEPPPWEGP